MTGRPHKREKNLDHKCVRCGHIAKQNDPNNPVLWEANPYAREICGDDTPDWECKDCLNKSAEEV